jgi:hypothetical protein
VWRRRTERHRQSHALDKGRQAGRHASKTRRDARDSFAAVGLASSIAVQSGPSCAHKFYSSFGCACHTPFAVFEGGVEVGTRAQGQPDKQGSKQVSKPKTTAMGARGSSSRSGRRRNQRRKRAAGVHSWSARKLAAFHNTVCYQGDMRLGIDSTDGTTELSLTQSIVQLSGDSYDDDDNNNDSCCCKTRNLCKIGAVNVVPEESQHRQFPKGQQQQTTVNQRGQRQGGNTSTAGLCAIEYNIAHELAESQHCEVGYETVPLYLQGKLRQVFVFAKVCRTTGGNRQQSVNGECKILLGERTTKLQR